jgi:hypothetical protein
MKIWLIRLISLSLTIVILGIIFLVEGGMVEATDTFILKAVLFVILILVWTFWYAEERNGD